MKIRSHLTAFAGILTLLAAPAVGETLSNTSIDALIAAGMTDEIIIAKIRKNPNSFDVSTDAIIAMKQRGISPSVIAAMITGPEAVVATGPRPVSDSPDPAVDRAPGLYLLQSWLPEAKMTRIDPTTANQTKTGGILGYALTGGIASASVKSVIPGEGARTVSNVAQPEFYLFIDEGASSLLGGSLGGRITPNEFSLVELARKQGRREARVGSMNIGGAKSGVMDKDRIAFSYSEVRPGVFKVTPNGALKPGEYAFLYTLASGSGLGVNSGGAMASRVFDFSIR